MKLNFAVGDKKFDATSPYDADENRYYVCVGQVLFTQTGLALYNAISRNIEKYQYLYDVLKTYIEYSIMAQLSRQKFDVFIMN